ncbi:hypothetical protein CFC21_045826 [Triticum aestivum]|uniref:Uncharacterized protein n=3 Tax=Triticinae TaxID=1648030 RepID=A0A453DY47_AEGTS|nr:uncharacterized protein LOC109749167 isoform X1 [Aegilops tauschii subsp. strangulata]XP_044355262.1 uncharacterized protein LOC123077115 isoform X2 [Triticum aestivum]KAF7034865.1 hypothetical protein CFC21_045826 [Triticum aestivum]
MLSGAPSKPQMRIGANRATREAKGAQPDEFTPLNDEDVTSNNEDEATTEIADYIQLREKFHGLIVNILKGIDIFIASGDGRAPMEASVMSCNVNVTIAFGDLGSKFRFTCEDKNPAIPSSAEQVPPSHGPSSAEQGMNDCGTQNFHVKYLGNINGASADGMEDENESLDPKD